MRNTRSSRRGILGAAVIAGLLLTSFSFRPAAAGVYACPDMTGPGGVPDGQVDASDLSAFAAAKGNQTADGDFNTDGSVDAIDQAMFGQVFGQSNFSCENHWKQLHARTPSCVDMTHDGYVDASDVSAFAAALASQDLAGDLSGDAIVDAVDQTILELSLGTVGACGIVIDFYPDPNPQPILPQQPEPTVQEVSVEEHPINPIAEQQSVATVDEPAALLSSPVATPPSTVETQPATAVVEPAPDATPAPDQASPSKPVSEDTAYAATETASYDATPVVETSAPVVPSPIESAPMAETPIEPIEAPALISLFLAAVGALGAALRALLGF
ncbi:MAG: hypothetical protein HYZ09_03635 [Candidatus Kerfeldbacteria bacterium]|nr:hypothetical protein [Candidatus Kerfeldbacteria bacterium]